jgi:outer membrane receptor for ferrienterochelin and colicins
LAGITIDAGAAPLRAALLGGAALILLAPPGAAQDESFALDQIVVTASGSAVTLRDAPASVTVLTQEDIERTPAQDLGDLLATVEGITVGRAGNAEHRADPRPRERYTLFLVDGKRVTSAPNLFRGNDFDSGWVPLDAIDHIEIVRGPMSSFYGSDAIGGVINIITKPVADEMAGSLTGRRSARPATPGRPASTSPVRWSPTGSASGSTATGATATPTTPISIPTQSILASPRAKTAPSTVR